jgi:hypothetical protein
VLTVSDGRTYQALTKKERLEAHRETARMRSDVRVSISTDATRPLALDTLLDRFVGSVITISAEMSRVGTHVEPLTESPSRDYCSHTRPYPRLKRGRRLPHQHRHQRTITVFIRTKMLKRPTINPIPVAEACRHSAQMDSLHLPPSTKPSLSPHRRPVPRHPCSQGNGCRCRLRLKLRRGDAWHRRDPC